ncbi:exported hypothetical protein [Mesorhizobium sp. ORS 3359]|nr:exported hypothetical protein [Mesorhizobium sp. ORS 3359]
MIIAVLALAMTAATLMATAFGLYKEVRQSRAHAEADRLRAFRTARRPPANAQPIGAGATRHAHAAFPGHVHFSGWDPALSGSVRGAGAFCGFSIDRQPRVTRRCHALFDQHMRFARGDDEGLPGGIGRDVAADRAAAGPQRLAMQRTAGIAPLAGQQLGGLFGVGDVADRPGKANGDFNRPGEPSLDHRETSRTCRNRIFCRCVPCRNVNLP